MSDLVDRVLEHHGIKGMKWGVRRSKTELASASPDKQRAEAAKAKLGKKGSAHALSNTELQDLVKRMNLEQQLSRLNAQTDTVSLGQRFAKGVVKNAGDLAVGVTREHAKNVATTATKPLADQLGKHLAEELKKSVGKRSSTK